MVDIVRKPGQEISGQVGKATNRCLILATGVNYVFSRPLTSVVQLEA